MPHRLPILYRIASSHLGEPVGAWIARERRPDEDLRRSWAKIATNLAEATDGLVEVHGSTVSRWSRIYSGEES
jgi:hypothetical protein